MRFIKKLQKLRAKGFKEAVKTVIRKILFGKGVTFFERFGFHILPLHYYSPIPCVRYLRKNAKYWYKKSSLTGIDINIERQKEFLNSLRPYERECSEASIYDNASTRNFGEGYGVIESHILHTVIRCFKPRKIIEVGCGTSTFFSINALSLNKIKDSTDSEMICIEPYPWPKLKEIKGECALKIIDKPVQEVGLETFKLLREGDILFIDSSHMVKIGSDVNYLYLEVLPNLNKGVIIHIHDIHFPYPAVNSSLWMKGEHRFWTETAFVQAFLSYNSVFEVLLCSSHLHYKAPEILQSVFSAYDPQEHFPSSLWLRKVG